MRPFAAQCAGVLGVLLYLNNSAESCRLHQLSEFHLQSLPDVDTLPKTLELCHLAGYVFYCLQ